MNTRSAFAITTLLLMTLPALGAAQAALDERSGAISTLDAMIGTWRIVGSAGGEIGTRTFRRGLDNLTLEWEENFGETRLQGLLGYDPAVGKFYYFGVTTNDDARTMFLSGTWHPEARVIRWDPVRIAPDDRVANRQLILSDMRLSEENAFTWSAFDDRWTVTFVRQ